MEQRIKLQQVLAEINQYEVGGQLHVFSLDYVKQDGKTGRKAKCRKGGGVTQYTGTTKGKFGYKVKQKGVLMLVNHQSGQPFSVKISRLTYYNGMRIWH